MADVVELIKAQHRELAKLLQQAEHAEPEETAALLRQVADLLLPHSQAEESFVYPAIGELDREEDDEVKDGAAEHHHIEGLLRELLDEAPSGPGCDGKLAAMIGELRHHVEEEEQDLLPVLSQQADDTRREALGARFAEVTGLRLPEDGAGRPGGGAEDAGDAGGGAATKAELYERAREQEISGRSTMSKEELAEALEGE